MAGFGKLRIWASLFCRFFLHFDFLLGCLVEGVFICYPSLFRDLFFKWFCLKCFSFFRFSLFGRTLGDMRSTLWNIWFPYIHLFRKRRCSINTLFDKYKMTASFSHCFFINFHDFFGIDVRIDFFFAFSWKWLPKWTILLYPGLPKKIYFSKPFLSYRLLWLPFG